MTLVPWSQLSAMFFSVLMFKNVSDWQMGDQIFFVSHEPKLNNLRNKTWYVLMFVCMLPMAGRTAGPIKTKLGIGTHADPGSVLVKVKVIYLDMQYNRIHACDT